MLRSVRVACFGAGLRRSIAIPRVRWFSDKITGVLQNDPLFDEIEADLKTEIGVHRPGTKKSQKRAEIRRKFEEITPAKPKPGLSELSENPANPHRLNTKLEKPKFPKAPALWLRLEKYVNSDQAWALIQAGELFLGGKAGFEKDLDRAIGYFHRAGELGERTGFIKLGKMYMFGIGVPIDLNKSKQFFELANLSTGRFQFDKLATDEASLLEEEELAKRGYEQSKFNMGIRHFFGIGIPQNKSKSLEYFTPELCAKFPNACEYRFRVLFDSNRTDEAMETLKLGVELKNERCMFLLAKTYLEGVIVEKDTNMAMKLFQRAAMLGDAFAHTELASLLLKQSQQQQQFAQKTEQLALFHFQHAAQLGDANAKARLAQYYLDRADSTNDTSLFEIAMKYLDEAEKERSIDALNVRAHLLSKSRPQFNIEVDHNKAWQLRQRAADAGHAEACYFYGCHVQKKDPTAALKYLSKAASRGHHKAQHDLAIVYINLVQQRVDPTHKEKQLTKERETEFSKRTEKWMKKACEGEHPEAYSRYGEFLLFGMHGLERNPNLALEYFIKGVQWNDPRSMFRLGMDIIERGTGTRDDVRLAVHYVNSATQMGDVNAKTTYAEFMLHGTMGVQRDPAGAFAMLHEDDKPISHRAKATLAWCYLRGVGTEKNEAKAIEMLQGNTMPRALSMLADCYYYGKGVEVNLKTSLELYRRAAVSKSARALHRIGLFYEKGFVVKRDIAKAVEFYKRAVEAGSTVSKIRLSVLEPKEYPMTGQNIKVQELDFLEEIDE